MQNIINSGIYILEIENKNGFEAKFERFGNQVLEKGYYYYVGSAQKNLTNRINRHLSKSKKIHWHIDNITSQKNVKISKIFVIPNADKNEECLAVNSIFCRFNLQFPIKNFGNSDCISCKSHLLFSKKRINYNHFCDLYQSIVCFIPSSNEIS